MHQLLDAIDQKSAEQRAGQGATTTDRDPNSHLNGIGGLHLARVNDPDLGDVQRAGQTAQHRGQGPEEEFVTMRIIATEHQTALRIANGHQYPPQL